LPTFKRSPSQFSFVMTKAPSSLFTSIVLTPLDLEQVTGRDRPTAQARILRLLGIPFAVHPVDGNLIVSRAAAEKTLGLTMARSITGEFEVNVEGIQKHGQTSTPH